MQQPAHVREELGELLCHRECGGLNYTESLLHSPPALTHGQRGAPSRDGAPAFGPPCFLSVDGDLGLSIHMQCVDICLLNLHDSD